MQVHGSTSFGRRRSGTGGRNRERRVAATTLSGCDNVPSVGEPKSECLASAEISPARSRASGFDRDGASEERVLRLPISRGPQRRSKFGRGFGRQRQTSKSQPGAGLRRQERFCTLALYPTPPAVPRCRLLAASPLPPGTAMASKTSCPGDLQEGWSLPC